MQTSQENRDTEISLQFLNRDPKADIQEQHDWLSYQFDSIPYMLYKFWLVLTSIIALSIEPHLILSLFSNTEDLQTSWGLAILSVSLIIMLLACGEMLFAIAKRKSEFAQKSLVKFQYSVVGIIISWLVGNIFDFDFNKSRLFKASTMIALPISLIVSIFGALAVLRAFKKNHPLSRSQSSQDIDFLEQNEVLASEISKYDRKLNRWPFQVYRFWLKLVIIIGVMMISVSIIYQIPQLLKSQNFSLIGEIVPFLMICIWTAFCCYEMEVVLNTKSLEKSKKALFHLKIAIFIVVIIIVIQAILKGMKFFILEYLLSVFSWVLVLLITFIGASRINKILEERDRFVVVSSYSGDHYIC